MRREVANTDRVIAEIATRQHGVISAAQLVEAGLADYTITRRVQAGRLHRVHRGVYAVGHPRLTFEGRCMAAVLAVGGGAVVSHQSAAAVWGMLKPANGPIHITIPRDSGRRRRRGIKVHRSHSLVVGVVTRRNGVAVTRAKRTLRDLHRTVPQPVYRRAIRRALDLRLIASGDLRDEERSRSEMERLFLGFCRRHGFPQPQVNARVGPYEVDFLWREQRIVVETDSWRHHGDRAAFEADRARDAQLHSFGFRVLASPGGRSRRRRHSLLALCAPWSVGTL
jgi:very-short-patch-repair endonuclease